MYVFRPKALPDDVFLPSEFESPAISYAETTGEGWDKPAAFFLAATLKDVQDSQASHIFSAPGPPELARLMAAFAVRLQCQMDFNA